MGQRATKPKGYQPTLQVTQEAKSRLVDWIESHGRPDMREIVGQAILFILNGPVVLQHVAFGLIPRDVAKNYADALRAAADQVERHLDRYGELPRDLVAEVQRAADVEGITAGAYLRDLMAQRSRKKRR